MVVLVVVVCVCVRVRARVCNKISVPRCLCVSISTCAKLTHTGQRSCSPCQSWVDYGNTKITQRALKSVGIFPILKLDTMRKKQKLNTMRKKQKLDTMRKKQKKKKAQPLCGSDWMTLDQLLISFS